MSFTPCNLKMICKYSLAVVLGFALASPVVSPVEARGKGAGIEREADCHRDKACMDAYAQKKSDWLACLDSAGLSEKKRKKLSAKVEAMGIHGLKRQEILSFNSKRKSCNSDFMKSLTEIHPQKSMEQDKGKGAPATPPPALDLTEKK